MIDWRPVSEPCPRDGTEFLAYDATTKKMAVCVWSDRWQIDPVQSDSEYGPSYEEFLGDSQLGGEVKRSVITHWALIEPPK